MTFLEGRIELLDELPLEPGSFDLVISEYVVNVSASSCPCSRG